MAEILHCKERQVAVRKNELLHHLHQQCHVFLIGMLLFAFFAGWNRSKDMSIARILNQMLHSGVLYLRRESRLMAQ